MIYDKNAAAFKTIFIRLNIEAIDFSNKLFGYRPAPNVGSAEAASDIGELELCKFYTFSYFLKHSMKILPEENFNSLFTSIAGNLNNQSVPL